MLQKKKQKNPTLFFTHMWQKKGGIKMTLKHKKYNLTKSNFYSIHGSKPNMGCEFDVQEQILIKLKYQF